MNNYSIIKLKETFNPNADSEHQQYGPYGIRVVEINSLSSPALIRNADNQLVVRAVITGSDRAPDGTEASAYDPNCVTGILLAKRDFSSGFKIEIRETNVAIE